jgi:multidrug resistance efflux pump
MPLSPSPQPISVFPELHSEEVHEIISRPPHWLVRWGITVFVVLLMILVAGCWLIKYPDIVVTPFTLTATDAPRIVMARVEGKLERLMIKDGQSVERDQMLAYTESVADHDQVLLLGNDIERFSRSIRQNQWAAVNELHVQAYTRLGEIQNDFQGFAQKLAELKTFLNGGFYLQKRKLLLDDLDDLKEMEKNLAEQMLLQKRDYDLAQDEFNVQEKLHRDKVIAPLEFKREKAKLLAREMPLKNLSSALIQNRSSQTGKQKEILELDNAISEHKNGFQQSLQTLQSSVETWKQRHVLMAPVAGLVSFSYPWQEQQHLMAGQELLTVEPVGSNYQGLVKIPQTNFGKLAEGQTVLIKLDGYPYREYGMVEGNLSQLSSTPGRDSVYWGYVALPNQLRTRYGRELPYRNGLKGTAEIVTTDRRLVERLVSTIRDGGK